jgi:Fe-S cluster assembly protein SufB
MHSAPVDVVKVFHFKTPSMAYTEEELKKELETKEYEYGFYTDIDSDTFPIGLNEEVIRKISEKKGEPEWMMDWRLQAYASWCEMKEPEWANVTYKKPDLQAISYYSAPKTKPKYDSLDDVDPELLKTFEKLGISLDEQKKIKWSGCRYRDGLRLRSYHI